MEGTAAVPGGNVWFKLIGGGRGLPLLVIHGGPGFPHNYLGSLGRLADSREVIFWDQLGCGRSESPSNAELWTMRRSVAELRAVISALNLDRFHLYGHSFGGMLAQQYVLDAPPQAVSLILSNSLASMQKFAQDVAYLKSLLDPATQSVIDHHESAGTTDSDDYQAACKTWFETYICRVLPWPAELEHSINNVGVQIYETMFGPSEFSINGNLRTWDILDRLAEICLPSLIIAGTFDECTPDHMWEMHRRIKGSRFALFTGSAHMPFIEQPERFDRCMRDFLSAHD
ncbi:proline iminopeptidase-family hydrolase [Mycobacterium montefiorense]|uniref:proline iminopeptidase-family hydrolase n=1 Tax=Mycobacterium montefiorense TaxID=154654 RepID=UPI0021F3977A|nr:proline iminopeptidase-family hydrolase [Mycobacterium montefiorense]